MNTFGRFVRAAFSLVLAVSLLISMPGWTKPDDGALPAADVAAIKSASRSYGTAWLTNDSDSVMATLTSDAVIVPSGMSPIQGEKAIRAFWWPEDSPLTRVTQFTSTEQDAGGRGDIGFVLGTFTLSFEYDGTDYTSGGTFVSVLRRLPDGSWKISYRAWSDG